MTRHRSYSIEFKRQVAQEFLKAESFMKTLKVEAVYPMAYETFTDVAEDLSPRIFRDSSTTSTIAVAYIPRWATSARNSSRIATPGLRSNPQPDACPARGAHSRLG